MNICITFATYNQIELTKLCVESLLAAKINPERIIAVDNGSTDGSQNYLRNQGVKVIQNKKNLGCGAAWNQGILEQQAEWTVVMNNDVIFQKEGIQRLVKQAIESQLKIASPSMIEGANDYDLHQLFEQNSVILKKHIRSGVAHAVCMAIHDSVWDQVGYFLPIPRLLGYEDNLFFERAREENLTMGIVGSSWLHHFGQSTQKAIKIEKMMDENTGLGDRPLFIRYLHKSWLDRKLDKIRLKKLKNSMRESELKLFGISVHGTKTHGENINWL